MMVRATLAFKNNYSLSVENVMQNECRGHHVYKETWNPYKGEKLMCNHDKREQAKIFEDYAVGTYKDSRLVNHIPIELSFLFCKFIKREITKYLLKSTAEKNWKMAQLYHVFIMQIEIKSKLKHFQKR